MEYGLSDDYLRYDTFVHEKMSEDVEAIATRQILCNLVLRHACDDASAVPTMLLDAREDGMLQRHVLPEEMWSVVPLCTNGCFQQHHFLLPIGKHCRNKQK